MGVAVITGGAKNLGRAIALQLAEDGHDIVVHYHSDASAPDADILVSTLRAAGSEALAVQSDLTIPSNNAELFRIAKDTFGGVDIAVNTVGRVLRKPITDRKSVV